MEDQVVLLDAWPSPFGVRARIALAEKGVEFECREENLKNKSHLLLKMNPIKKQIPVLIHKGRPVCESLTIVEYIDEAWKHKFPLSPCDPYQRARARFWADYIDKKIYGLGKQMWRSKGEAREAAKKELISCYKLLEGELGEKPYFGGERFGLVDLALIPFSSLFLFYEECGINMAQELPKIVDWTERCMERKTVADSVPDKHKVYHFFLEFQKQKHSTAK